MGLALQGPERRSPEVEAPPPKRQVVVNQTPGGSLRVADSVPVEQTPGGSVRLHRPDPVPLSANVLERVEAMGLSDEEVEEMLEEAPWHIQRWLHGLEQQGRECCTPKPISPTTTAGEFLNEFASVASVHEPRDAQSSLKISSVDADVRPSTSGLSGTISKPVGRRKDQGSDFDSDFDDEFDVEVTTETGGLPGERRQIPDDEELDEPTRDVIHAVERAMDVEADRMLGVSNSFVWQQDFESFRGVPEVFSGPSPGPLKDYDSPYDAFTDIWSNDTMELITAETNRYARQTIDAMKANGTLEPTSRLHQWQDTNANEIAVLFAVFMYMGIDSRSSQHEYWKANDYLEMPRFKELLSYNRFLLLNKFLHFVDNSDSDNSSAAVAPSNDLGGKTTKVVLDLLKDLEHRGHCVTMDNFYSSPSLARYLKSLGFDCLGTLRVNRKHVPNDISKIPENVVKGTMVARHCGDLSIVSWKDSKLVSVISTYHTNETYIGSKAGKPLVKPVCVKDYNNTMGGVDLKDQKLSMYLLERKRGVKWYVKMFKRLLNVSIHNAFVMCTSSLRRRGMDALTHREFRYTLAKSLVDRHHHSPPTIREQIGEVMRLRRDVLHEPHYASGRNNRKRCHVCYRQNNSKLVHTKCETCDVFLCFGTCWREWHSLSKLKGRESRGRSRSMYKLTVPWNLVLQTLPSLRHMGFV
ncbi:hypothetical protein evm_001835 [Chilo suppressalis]|nr:hypothetical protein evm_001835 [Chilo suppressalis]